MSEPIAGYRVLTPEERAHINDCKHLEAHVLRMLEMIRTAEYDCDERWLNIARTHIEQGFMAAIRSIARPTPIDPKE